MNEILNHVSTWIEDSLSDIKQRDAKTLIGMDTEKLAYKTLFVLEEAFGKQPPVCSTNKYAYWNASIPLATLSCKIGALVLIADPEENKEKREAKRFRVGYHLLNTFFDQDLLEITKGPKARDAYRVRVKRTLEDTWEEFMDVVDKIEAPEPIYTRPQYEKPAPFRSFWHPVAGELVRNANEQVVKKFEYSNMPKVYEVINRHMDIAWNINNEILDVYLNSQEDPIFTFEEKDLTDEQLSGLSRERDKVLEIASKVGDRKFWECMFYDNRGRLYSSTIYLSHAASKLSKSLFLYDEKKPLGDEGYFWLLVHASNCYGFDKETLDKRHDLANENLNEWLEWAKDPITNKEWQQADSPFEFLAAIIEINKSHQHNGGPYDYPSGLPVAWDASCSGLQVLSALSNDEIGGKLSNLTDTDERGDYYLYVADDVWSECDYTEEEGKIFANISNNLRILDTKVDKALASGNSPRIVKALDERKEYVKENKEAIASSARVFWGRPEMKKLRRKICKRSCMTYFYSCGAKTMANAMYTDFASEPEFKGLTQSYCFWLSKRIYDSCRSKMPRQTQLMDLFIQLGLADYKDGVDFSLEAPLTRFLFMQDYKKDKTKQVRVYYKKKELKLKIVVAKNDKIDRQKVLSATSPNVVHMLDSQVVAGVILDTEYDVSCIHDSFSTHASNAGKLFEDTRSVFVKLFERPILKDFLQQKKAEDLLKTIDFGTLDINETYNNENCFS